MIKNLFNRNGSRQMYEKWWEIRDMVFLVNNLTPNNSVSLSTIFLTRSEIRVLIDKVRPSEQIKKEVDAWVTARENDIKELRKDVRNGKQLSKVKLEKFEKYFKVSKTGAAAVASRLMHYFNEDEEVARGHPEREKQAHSQLPDQKARRRQRHQRRRGHHRRR